MNFKHGDKVTCYIDGVYINDARISINMGSRMYICNNIVGNTTSYCNCEDMLGYKYSYDFYTNMNIITDLKLADTRTEITWDNLQDGDVVIDEDGDECVALGVCGRIIFLSYSPNKNLYRGGYTKEELIDNCYTIKQPTPSQPISDEIQKAIEHLQANGYKVTKE